MGVFGKGLIEILLNISPKMCWSKSGLYNSLDVLGARSLLLIFFLPGVKQNKCRTVAHRTVAHRTVAHRTVAHWTVAHQANEK